jgi:hypothetical protein
MPEALVALLPIGFVALVIVIALIAAHNEKVRRERLASFAAENGFEYFPHGDPTGAEPPGCSFSMFGSTYGQWFQRFAQFSPFGQGHSQRASNLLIKRDGGKTWYFFDYQYTTGSGKHQTTHSFWISVVESQCNFPGLRIRGESFFDRIGAFIGFRDIEFESAEFNDRFHVSSADERFAYSVVHPSMMEFLMAGWDVDWQLLGNCLLIAKSGRMDVGEVGASQYQLAQFLDQVPEFVWRDYGFAKPY